MVDHCRNVMNTPTFEDFHRYCQQIASTGDTYHLPEGFDGWYFYCDAPEIITIYTDILGGRTPLVRFNFIRDITDDTLWVWIMPIPFTTTADSLVAGDYQTKLIKASTPLNPISGWSGSFGPVSSGLVSKLLLDLLAK